MAVEAAAQEAWLCAAWAVPGCKTPQGCPPAPSCTPTGLLEQLLEGYPLLDSPGVSAELAWSGSRFLIPLTMPRHQGSSERPQPCLLQRHHTEFRCIWQNHAGRPENNSELFPMDSRLWLCFANLIS